MDINYLDFEQTICELDAKLAGLRETPEASGKLAEAIKSLEEERDAAINKIFSSLSAWQVSQLSRHPLRPYTLDYVPRVFTEFQELHGDRHFSDDLAIVGGLARLEGRPVMVIGHQKGRDTREKVRRNFGMPRPEGYRKALRLMQLAERFRIPVLTFIDTPGAYPGIDAEERGQSEAIARNLLEMSRLKTPILCTVVGEGGSGGALAIGVGDRLYMLKYSTYSVISPEGCASILWKSADKAQEAAEAMALIAPSLLRHGLIDGIVDEPLGGAHRDVELMSSLLRAHLFGALRELEKLPVEQLLAQRYDRLMRIGAFKG